MVQHPAVQDDIVGFVTTILHHALSDAEIREQVLATISETEIAGLIEANATDKNSAAAQKHETLGRQQITARDAAKMLRYNPRYFSRKAKDWGLTKIRMSRTSCRYYLDEVEQLAVERGIRKAA